MRQVDASDYVPGPVIDSPELLGDVLRCEEYVFVDGKPSTTAALREAAMRYRALHALRLERGAYRRAWLRERQQP